MQRKSRCELTIRLLGRTDIRRLAKELEFRPRKALGQNFVHDANTVRRVVSSSGVGRSDHVLEVGPGLGSLTLALLDRGATVALAKRDDIKVVTNQSTIEISINYTVPIDLQVYQFNLNFHPHADNRTI